MSGDDNLYYTYIYRDPSNMEPFYVGKGCGKRAYFHLKYGNEANTHFDRKTKKDDS